MNKTTITGLVMVFAIGNLIARAADPKALEAGKAIFDSKCAACHGKDANGNPGIAKMYKLDISALDFTDKETQAKKDEELIKTITEGKNKMQAWKDKLKPEEIKNVVSYIRSLGSAQTGTTEKKSESGAGAVTAGAELFASKCVSCHGKDGKGAASMVNMLKVDVSALNLTDKDTLAKKDEELLKIVVDGKGKMPSYKDKLKEDEIKSTISYTRSIAGK